MLNTRLDHAFRNPQPVLVVISCLCLCLGSCFPSSEPLNRIPATQSKTQIETSSGGQTVQTTAATVTAATASNKVFSLNSDPRFRNMDTVVQDRLDSVGQVSLSTTSATLLVNSTRGTSDSLPSASSSSSSTASPPSSSKNDRQRQRPNLKQKKNKSTRERSQKSKSKKRRLSSERKGKTRQQEQQQLGLDARAGRRNRRMKRIDCARLAQRSKRIRQLENSISFFLAVYPDGTINGTHNRSDRHSKYSYCNYYYYYLLYFWFKLSTYVCLRMSTDLSVPRCNQGVAMTTPWCNYVTEQPLAVPVVVTLVCSLYQ